MSYTDPGIDMVKSADTIRLLGMFPHDLDNPAKFQKLKEIITFLDQYSNGRIALLKVISRPHSGDKLDLAWEYVQLQKERLNIIGSLNPDDFEPDIAEELRNNNLSLENIKRIKTDIFKKKSDNGMINEKTDLTKVEETLQAIESLNADINRFTK